MWNLKLFVQNAIEKFKQLKLTFYVHTYIDIVIDIFINIYLSK